MQGMKLDIETLDLKCVTFVNIIIIKFIADKSP